MNNNTYLKYEREAIEKIKDLEKEKDDLIKNKQRTFSTVPHKNRKIKK